LPLPKENLDNKTFDELLTEALSRLPIYAPEWSDHNVHDPGITFVELFAWLTEIQIYRLNKITDKNKTKFLKLLGVPYLEPAKPSKVDVTFTKQTQNSLIVPAGTKLAAADPVSEKDIIFETQDDLNMVDSKLEAVLSCPNGIELINNTEANENENVYYYAFRYNPKKDDALYLGFDKSLIGEIVLAFYLYEEKTDVVEEYGRKESDVSTSVKLKWEYFAGGDWKVAEIQDETNYLTVSGKIQIKLTEEMEKTTIDEREFFWLRCRVEEEGYEIPPRIDVIRLNTVSAIQCDTSEPCVFSGSGLPEFYIDLKNTPILEKTLKVQINGIDWDRVEDFDASKPGDRHYVADLAAGRIRFGDGINGKVPPEGKNNICVSYSCGGGEWGNVPPNTVNIVLSELPEELCVTNKKAASGGMEAETLEQAIHRVRKDMKKSYRAVTSEDYEYLAKNTPGIKVARAKAIPRYHKIRYREIPGIVTVVVVPYSPYTEPMPSPGFLETVYKHLDKHRLLTTELFVIPPQYVEISVIAEVVIKLKYLKVTVEETVREALKNFLNPIKGWDGNGWPFGRSVYLSEIYELIEGVEGVDYVDVESVKLKRGKGEGQEDDVNIPEFGLVFSGEHDINVREETNVYD